MSEDRSQPGKMPEEDDDVPRIDSADLFQGHRQVYIVHGDDVYILRQTRTGKLILHK